MLAVKKNVRVMQLCEWNPSQGSQQALCLAVTHLAAGKVDLVTSCLVSSRSERSHNQR
jgi:hypothetical protein